MPSYIFTCYEDEKGCGHTFDILATMDEAPSLKPTCPNCHKRKSVARNYELQNVVVYDSSPTTLGSLADRNSERMSDDQKNHLTNKNNAYRDQAFTGSLPKGGSLVPRNDKGQRIASTKQRKKDIRHGKNSSSGSS
tara:strand:- start:831 stop:1238 length:408 start_codon:yes stop_codon:yes gene_type:complete